MNRDCRATLRETQHYTALTLHGDLTKQAEETLLGLRSWQEGLDGGKTNLVIDFADVPYINSAGIALLIRIVRSGLKAGYRTFAFGVSGHYQKLFRMVGLTEYMAIYPSEYAIAERIEQDRG
ncbi:STAS domain-containing protein [Paenibacillus antri]|uniref:STAS domain-containing protein n=1 Tax=Paenibacillus antri TaxID=2582848 RepID=A0A5R9GFD2_9BACL|nr:STAS domain-containing protein [Paenibacillus antri]TLS52078.1 STAS domain-containing protein [Paenibacillus antri]